MSQGIRATVEFHAPETCLTTRLSSEEDTTVTAVRANVCPGDCESVTEFSVDGEAAVEADVTQVFSHGSTGRYRLTHEGDVSCPCECLGTFGCPVDRYDARDGTLRLVFHAADYEELQATVGALRENFSGVDIKRFVRSPAGDPGRDDVLVDRSKLTDRQRQVAETAYEMGYFERPREANATEIAAELDISPSTFREHLAAAESKLLGDVL